MGQIMQLLQMKMKPGTRKNWYQAEAIINGLMTIIYLEVV